MNHRFLARVFPPLTACAGLALLGFALAAGGVASKKPGIFAPGAHPYGHTYAEWSAKYWQWGMGLPLEGHPFLDTPDFDVTEGQSGKVWFLSSVFGIVERTCTIPADTALFVGMLNVETSSLEGVPTEAEQEATSIFFADHILDLACTLDGVPVTNLDAFRFLSPQFSFTAPSPWIFGETGGAGTSVADGYYVFLKPLSAGEHELHIEGAFHFAVAEGDPFDFDDSIDMTYHLIQLDG
ncbi:MAG TPA: hypothetical protein VFY71_14600 [Planctomycetota bacterium]|nr:hypothetical protein [Planctomycetota bacterium]